MEGKKNKIGVWTASSFVISNMVGTGVFTSLGFQLMGIHSPAAIAMIWIVGGVIAFCGALTYSELGAAMPRSGGEYHYLSVIYHPLVGFISGWVSLVVGFAAPVALACMAMSSYVSSIFPEINPTSFAIFILMLLTSIHLINIKVGTTMQNVLTICKIIIILLFIAAGFICSKSPDSCITAESCKDFSEILTAGFATSLIWVYYAYSGWNASAYIANDIDNPRKTVPRSLLMSTVFVIVLYVLVNWVFLRTTPSAEMEGQVEIGLISARHIFGPQIGSYVGLLIAALLLSCISSMIFVGPRVAMTIGEDYPVFRFLAKKSKKNNPYAAIIFQFAISLLLIVTKSFELVTKYTGVLLSLCSLMTVFGVYVHRKRYPSVQRPYKTWGYPVTPAVFCLLIIFSISYLVRDDYMKTFVTKEQPVMWMTVMSLATIAMGCLVYMHRNVPDRYKKRNNND